MRSRRGVTFLLGAGASVDAGLPTSVGLLERFEAYLEDLQRTSSLMLPVTWQLWRSLRDDVIRDGSYIDIEAPFAALIALRDRNNSPLSRFVQRWDDIVNVEYFKGACDELLWLANCFLTCELTFPHDAAYLKGLFDVPLPRPIDVFTLNYDIALELAANATNETFTTGFTTDVELSSFPRSYGMSYWDSDVFDTAPIRIYKLHGSVRWTVQKPYRSFELMEYSLDRFQCDIKDRMEESRTPRCILPMTDFDRFVPPIIFGTANKLSSTNPYAFMFGRFAEALRTKQLLIIIGYGVRDQHINHIVFNEITKGLKVVFVNIGMSVPNFLDSVTWYAQNWTSVVSTAAGFLTGQECAVLSWGHLSPFSSESRTPTLCRGLEGVLAAMLAPPNHN